MKRGFSLSASVFFGAVFALTSFSNPPEVFAQRCRDTEIRASRSRNKDFSRGTEWSTTNSRLVFQNDGNLVLIGSSGNVLWATGTENRADRLSIQRDGNVVLYNGNQAVWATNTDRNSGAFLTLQCDGNLVVYDGSRQRNSIWSSGTDGGRRGTSNASQPPIRNDQRSEDSWQLPWRSGNYRITKPWHGDGYGLTSLDFDIPAGTEIVAPIDSQVLSSCNAGNNHRAILFRAADGQKYSIIHVTARRVKESYQKGETIGVVASDVPDNKCARSTGVHLHMGFPTRPFTMGGQTFD